MAKQKENEAELQLKKIELECVDKENDLYITTDLLPTDVVVCELEVNDVQYNKLKKKNEVVPETQLREYAGGFFEHIYVNSEGYNESLKLTIKGKK